MGFINTSPTQNIKDRTIPITTTFSENVYKAAEKYKKDFGHRKLQDVIRLSLAALLKKEGYL